MVAVTAAPTTGIKHLLNRIVVIGLASVLGVTALAYALDYAVFRYRVSTNHQPFGQFTVTSYDAIEQKSGKTQLIFNPRRRRPAPMLYFPKQDTYLAGT